MRKTEQGSRFAPSSLFSVALTSLLFFGVLTIWVPRRWAVGFLEAGSFLLVALWVARWVAGRFALAFHPVWILVALAPIWGLTQLLLGITAYRADTWEAVLFWAAVGACSFLAYHSLSETRVRKRFLTVCLAFGAVVCILGVAQFFTSKGKIFWLFDSGYPDAFGPFVYKNNFAAFAELLLPIAVFRAFTEDRKAVPYVLLAAAIYGSLVASASRAGLVLGTAEFLLVPILLARRAAQQQARRMVLVSLWLLGAAAGFSVVAGWGAVIQRFSQPDPFVHRREMLLSALQMARERPLVGFGLGTFQEVYPAYALFDIGLVVNHAHNDWAEWLVEGGVVFLGLLGAVAFIVGRACIHSIWGLGPLFVFLHAFVDYPFQRLGLAVWIFALGMAVLRDWEQRGKKAQGGFNP